jgi:hypothetical protein
MDDPHSELARTNTLACYENQKIGVKINKIGHRAQYSKTFYNCNMLMFINRVFVPGRLFQSNLRFAGKARAYQCEAYFKCFNR